MKLGVNQVLVSAEAKVSHIGSIGIRNGLWANYDWSVTGVVLQLPEELVFYGRELKSMWPEGFKGHKPLHLLEEARFLAKHSLEMYEQEFRGIDVGDTVIMHYMNRLDNETDGLMFHSGDAMIISYDSICGKVMDGKLQAVNGWIFVEPLGNKDTGDIAIHHERPKLGEGRVISVSPPALWKDYTYCDTEVEVGDIVTFRDAVSTGPEYSEHRKLNSGKEFWKISHRDITTIRKK